MSKRPSLAGSSMSPREVSSPPMESIQHDAAAVQKIPESVSASAQFQSIGLWSDPSASLAVERATYTNSSNPSSYNTEITDGIEEPRQSSEYHQYPMQNISTSVDNDVNLTFHPTSRQGLGINLSTITPADAILYSSNHDKSRPSFRSDGIDLQISSVASRRGQQVAPLSTSAALPEEEIILPIPPTPASVISYEDQPRISSIMTMPDTPLKRAPSREEDRQRITALDSIIRSLSPHLERSRDIHSDPAIATKDSPEAKVAEAGANPSDRHEEKKTSIIDIPESRKSQESTYDFTKGPQGYVRNTRHSDSIVSIQTLNMQERVFSSDLVQCQSGRPVSGSTASAFAYHANGPIGPNNAIQHLDDQILSMNEFDQVVAAMQFDPPIQKGGPNTQSTTALFKWIALLPLSFLTLIFIALFFVFDAPYLWFAFSPAVDVVAAYLCLVSIIGFLVTAKMDPGILPLNLDIKATMAEDPKQTFLVSQRHQPDDDSPSKRLALARVRSHITSVFTPTPRQQASALPPLVASSPGSIPHSPFQTINPSSLQNNEDSVTPAAKKIVALAHRDTVRATPIKDSLGRKTWLLSNGSDSDLSSPPKRTLRFLFQKETHQLNNQTLEKGKQIMPIQIIVNKQLVQMRWCPICLTYPTPRTYHCYKCNHCCQDFHYHCSWLNNDIGARNLPVFIASLSTSLICCIYIVVFAALHLNQLARLDHFDDNFHGIHLSGISDYTGSFRNAVAGSPTSVVIFTLGLLGITFLIYRLGLHLLCAFKGQTVLQRHIVKSIVKRFHIDRPRNPFDTGDPIRNASKAFLLPFNLSKFDRHHLQASPIHQS